MQFPDVAGFQDPIKWQNKSFKRINGPYVQIIHINGNHWVTIAGIHCSLVKFYDSKYRSLSEDAIEQIALITQPSHNFINVDLETTQFQTGYSDCGLYAIAFATEVCYGNNPASYRLVMRASQLLTNVFMICTFNKCSLQIRSRQHEEAFYLLFE